MKRTLVAVGVVVGVLLLAWGWLHFIHDPDIRERAKLDARDRVVDSVFAVHQDSLAAFQKRDSLRADSILRAQEQARLATAEVQRLQRRQATARSVVDSIIVSIPDSALRRALAVERAAGDSVLAAKDSTITAQQTQLALFRVRLADRDARIAELQSDLAAVIGQRDAWKRRASPGLVERVVGALPYVAGAVAVGYVAGKVG